MSKAQVKVRDPPAEDAGQQTIRVMDVGGSNGYPLRRLSCLEHA